MVREGKGWISLYRKIQDSWLWQDIPFSRGQAFIDLLLLANHQDKKIIFNGNLIELKRGQFITSIRKLCDKWGWSNSKVKKFLDTLQVDEMIFYKSDTKKTIINIVNYRVYQISNDIKNTTERLQKHNKNYAEISQEHANNNNDNNDNNVNNSSVTINYIEFFNSNFHLINSYELEILTGFEKDGLDPKVIKLALEKAIENNVRNIKYVKSILQNWLEKNIKTVEAVNIEEERFKREMEEKKSKFYNNVEKTKPGIKIDSFNNYKQRKYDGTDGGMTFNELEKKLLGWE